jgi:hypothetical protein
MITQLPPGHAIRAHAMASLSIIIPKPVKNSCKKYQVHFHRDDHGEDIIMTKDWPFEGVVVIEGLVSIRVEGNGDKDEENESGEVGHNGIVFDWILFFTEELSDLIANNYMQKKKWRKVIESLSEQELEWRRRHPITWQELDAMVRSEEGS